MGKATPKAQLPDRSPPNAGVTRARGNRDDSHIRLRYSFRRMGWECPEKGMKGSRQKYQNKLDKIKNHQHKKKIN